jgi:phage FluMu protein Com
MIMVSKPQPPQLITWRCHQCGRIIAQVKIAPGTIIAIKCHSCNAMNTREAA